MFGIAFQTSPSAGFAVLVAGSRSEPVNRLEENVFALSQASFKVEEPRLQRGYAFGPLYADTTIQAGNTCA